MSYGYSCISVFIGGVDKIYASLSNTVFSNKCPNCGIGNLYKKGLQVNDNCESCDLLLKDHDCGDGPAVFGIFILGFIIIPLAIVIDVKFSPPYLFHIIVWPFIVLFSTFFLLRKIKSYFIYKKFIHHH